MGGVPSVPTDENQTVEVINAGYSRTGTVSTALALEKLLGKPVMHGGTQLLGREDAYAKLWREIFANRHDKPVLLKLLRQATAGFAGISDAPGFMFLPELLELYPDAKVVLVTRDPERWLRSLEAMMKSGHLGANWLKLILFPCPTWRWVPYWIEGMGDVEKERLGGDFGKENLTRHNDWVRKLVDPSKLLTMELKEGWEPLAKFLGKPVPEGPFPRANDEKATEELSKKIFMRAMLIWSGIFSGVGLAAWVGWRAYAS